MWIAKVMNVTENEDGSQELGTVCILANQRLRIVYEAALWECKDQKCALAAIYTDMNAQDVLRDDPTKKVKRWQQKNGFRKLEIMYSAYASFTWEIMSEIRKYRDMTDMDSRLWNQS